MNKKTKIGLSIAASFILICTILFFITKTKINSETTIYSLIPTDALVVIEGRNPAKLIQKILTGNNLWAAISYLDDFNKTHKQLLFVDSIIKNNQIFNKSLSNTNFIISIHSNGRKFENLICISIPSKLAKQEIHLFMEAYTSNNLKKSTRRYEGEIIIKLKDMLSGSLEWNCCLLKDVLIISQSSILMEEAIRQSALKPSINQTESFTRLTKTASSSSIANIYINLGQAEKLSLHLRNPSIPSKLFSHLVGWAELDLKIDANALLLNGFSCADSSRDFLNIFNDQSPQNSSVENVLPSNTAFYQWYGISNFNKFNESLNQYYLNTPHASRRDRFVANIQKSYNIDISKIFNNYFSNEICFVITSLYDSITVNNNFVLIKTDEPSSFQNSLFELVDSIGHAEMKATSSFIHKTQINKQSFSIIELPINYLFESLFGSIFKLEGKAWICFFDDFLIAGNSKEALKKYIRTLIENNTIANTAELKYYSENISAQSNLCLYYNYKKGKNLTEQYLKKEMKSSLHKNFDKFSMISPIILQFSNTGDAFFTNLLIPYYTGNIGSVKQLWEVEIDSVISAGPICIQNHKTGNKDVFLQDLSNSMHLIDKDGKTIWRKKISEQIVGTIFEVDLFKNNKYQILFATASQLYAIDRNGNYVNGFPIKLKNKTSIGAAVFDYDKDRNYRIFIASDNNTIYTFDKKGVNIKDWKQPIIGSKVIRIPQTFRINNKDYILICTNKTISILNRKGEVSELINVNEDLSINNIFYLTQIGKEPHFITSTSVGNLLHIYLNGSAEIVKLKERSDNHFYYFADINNDQKEDNIFISDNKLESMSAFGNPIFIKRLPAEVSQDFKISYIQAGKPNIFVSFKKQDEITSIDAQGAVCEGFPVRGGGGFTFDQMDKKNSIFYLIVGSSNNFLYTYVLQ